MMLRIAILLFVFWLGIMAGRWGYKPAWTPGEVCSGTIPGGSRCHFGAGPMSIDVPDGKYVLVCDIPLGDGGLP